MLSTNNVKNTGLTLAACFSLSACGGGSNFELNPTSNSAAASGFGTVAGASVEANLDQPQTGTVTDAANPGLGLVAYVGGFDESRSTAPYTAIAGVAPGANVGPARTTGTATSTASYGYTLADNVTRSGGRTTVDRTSAPVTGTIFVTANFDAGTVTGDNGNLSVNGTISGTTLGGSVVVDHDWFTLPDPVVNGSLRGEIGANGLVGAFSGNDPDTTMAGGIVGAF